MFVNYQQDQQFLLPPNLEELLPKDHLARMVNEIVESLDLGSIKKRYTDLGRPAYHPKMLIKALFFGYATGVRSSRKIAKALETDIAFMWLGAMNRPDFRTISDFRKNNLLALEELFSQIVATCISSGMATVGKIAIDGTKIKASASRESMKDEVQLSRMLDHIEKKIKDMLNDAEQVDEEEDKLYGDSRGDELPEELIDETKRREKIKEALEKIKKGKKAKVSITDKDSSLMKVGGRFYPAYNAQAVASEEGLILAADVSDKGNDNHLAGPMIEKTQKTTGIQPCTVLADAGYHSGKTLNYLKEKEIDGYISINKNLDKIEDKKSELKIKYKKEDFIFLPEHDCYIYKKGRALLFEQLTRIRGKTLRRYRCTSNNCVSRAHCTKDKKGRTIYRSRHEELYVAMKEKMKKSEAKHLYKKRKVMVEPAFSVIKGPLGFEKFSLRGLDKTKSEWLLICSAFNIFKMWKARQKIANMVTV